MTSQYSVKIEELESIRGIAALLIVFHHLPTWNSIIDIGFLNNAYLMVELFFVLSGFVIFYAYAGKLNSMKDVLKFQFLRFGRLYPIHLLFLITFAVFEIAKYFAASKLGISSTNSVPFETNNLMAFVKNIFLLSAVLPHQDYTFNHPAWSISVEFYTYLVFGLGAFFFRRNSIFLFAAFAIVSAFLLVTQNTFGFDKILRCFAGFFLGCLTAHGIKNLKPFLPNFTIPVMMLIIVLFVHFKTTKDWDVMMFVFSAMLIVTIVLSEDGMFKRILRLDVLTWLGTISYSVYMSHAAVAWVVNQVVRLALKRPEVRDISGNNAPQLSVIETLSMSFLIVVLVLVVSALCYRYIEMPMRQRSRQFANTRLA